MADINSKIVVLCPYCTAMYKVDVSLKGKTVTCATCNRQFVVDAAATDFYERSLNKNLLFCKVALNYGFAKAEDVESVLADFTRKKREQQVVAIETLFLERGVLDEAALSKINRIIPLWGLRQKEKKYAADAVARGIISHEKARNLLIKQARHFDKTGAVKTIQMFLEEEKHLSTSPSTGQQALKERGEPVPEVSQPIRSEPKSASAPIAENREKQVEKAIPVVTSKPAPEAEKQDLAVDSGDKTIQVEKAPNVVSDMPEVSEEGKPAKPVSPAVESEATGEAETKSDTMDSTAPDGGEDGFIVKQLSGLELSIHPEGLLAFLRAPEGIPAGTTVESIRQILESEGIVYGTVEDALIKGFINSKVFREKPFKVAEGRPSKKGKEGHVTWHFDTEPLKVGTVSDSGDIDFKNRGEIPFVKKDTLLAEITPTVFGKNGRDVFGMDIAVPSVSQVVVRCEEGTVLSEDKRKIFATKDGQPKLTFGNAVYVLSELKIAGDVGFETGHIEFNGNIIISGTVQSDFRVSGANITANEILGAEILATGDVTVKNGINGSRITAEGNVNAKFVNKGEINAFGNVLVEKELIDSVVKCSGGCQVARGKIISSEIFSKQAIEALEIGTQMAKPSRLRIGVDDHINSEIEVVKDAIEKIKEKLTALKETLEGYESEEKETHLLITEFAQIQDRSQLSVKEAGEKLSAAEEAGNTEEVEKYRNEIETLNEAIRNADDEVNGQFDRQDSLLEMIEEIKGEIETVEESLQLARLEKKRLSDWIKRQKTVAYVKTKGTIFGGTMIIGPNDALVVKENITNVKIKEVPSPHTETGWEMKAG